MTYTDAERQAALRTYVDDGPQEAAAQTGIGLRTIYRWAAAEGLATTAVSEKTRAATTAAKERAGMLRSQLQVLLLEQAVASLHDMNGAVPLVIRQKGQEPKYIDVPASPEDKKNLALTAAVLIDKYRLEAGEVTGRTESTVLQGKSDHEQRVLADIINGELERRAYADTAGREAADTMAESATAEPSPA